MKKYRSSIILWLVFEAIAIWLWQATGNLFFLLNFSYIGFCIGFGGILFAEGQSCFLQVHLPHNGVLEADELLLPDSH